MGLLKRDEERNRLSPIGGKRNPSSRLARIMTPRCTGWIPKAVPSGMISGVRTTMAEKISNTLPSTSSTIYEDQQKDLRRVDPGLHNVQQLVGDLSIHQVARESHGAAEKYQPPASAVAFSRTCGSSRNGCRSRCIKQAMTMVQASPHADIPREHLGLLQHHAESCDTLFVHATQELVHVRESPLKDLQQRRADLRGQPFEIKALQDRTQMLVTAR